MHLSLGMIMRRNYASIPVLALTALALAPTLAGCNKIQARVELKKGNAFYMDETYREALEQFKKGLELDPSATFAWRSVGLSAMALYRPGVDNAENKKFADTAVDAFKKYLASYPSDDKVEEYLVTTLINAQRYDEALARLKSEALTNSNKPGVQQAIITTLAKAGRLDEAFQWADSHGAKDATLYYSIAVACWSKSYNDPTIDSATRARVVETGLAAAEKSVNLKPDYFEAMAYYNLLYREKAKLELDPVKQQEWIAKAEEWTKKAIAVRDAQKAREAAQKKT
jgi:tetratricopeptide (TPR) repeat protein